MPDHTFSDASIVADALQAKTASAAIDTSPQTTLKNSNNKSTRKPLQVGTYATLALRFRAVFLTGVVFLPVFAKLC